MTNSLPHPHSFAGWAELAFGGASVIAGVAYTPEIVTYLDNILPNMPTISKLVKLVETEPAIIRFGATFPSALIGVGFGKILGLIYNGIHSYHEARNAKIAYKEAKGEFLHPETIQERATRIAAKRKAEKNQPVAITPITAETDIHKYYEPHQTIKLKRTPKEKSVDDDSIDAVAK